ncbi:hypothetical protein RR46_03246 [Papilio xuthus]|uniref:Secreted protein n=1 Tax=Papilio xuthus TaxID=66420 RepID=A0A194QI81_PAPXU|nr:hypothetical protein RR46_03246 [Papilio xuthus]
MLHTCAYLISAAFAWVCILQTALGFPGGRQRSIDSTAHAYDCSKSDDAICTKLRCNGGCHRRVIIFLNLKSCSHYWPRYFRGISTERGERADCRVGSAPLPTSVHDATQPEHHCPQAPEAAAAAADVTGARAGPRPARSPAAPAHHAHLAHLAPLALYCRFSVTIQPSRGQLVSFVA